MNRKILIVEDQFVEANDLQLILGKAGYEVCGIARSVPIAREMIVKSKPELVLLDIFLKGKETGIDLARELNKERIAFIYLSANSNEETLNAAKATQPYGFLVKPFREKDLLIMLEIAWYRHEHSKETSNKKENILQEKLTAIKSSLATWDQKLLEVCRNFQQFISFDYITAGFNTIAENAGQAVSYLRIGHNEYQKIGLTELSTISGKGINELKQLNNGTLYKFLSDTFHMRTCVSMPLYLAHAKIFTISFYSRQENTYQKDYTDLFNHIGNIITDVIESILNESKISISKSDSELYNKTVSVNSFEEIVGRSPQLLNVFELDNHVAASGTSVLILGESGTGKERIADAIYNLSPRRNKPFVKVNCAALPATLIESELFGHEKGSFTGALEKRIGKFEKADQGTIFLDEVGEMPLDLQVKLLRVLQEKYIERIGAKEPTPINVRIIAATNRNLEKEVAEGRFRLDLYYRLNVFPVELPPLRDRLEDIPLLANHFVQYFNQKCGKQIEGLDDEVLKSLMSYHWPGNIRELENIIERSVLLAKGTKIEDVSIPRLHFIATSTKDPHLKTIHENERDHIIAVLKKCNGRVWGTGGAAEVLNIPPSTLKSKMKKLSIHKGDAF